MNLWLTIAVIHTTSCVCFLAVYRDLTNPNDLSITPCRHITVFFFFLQ